MARATTLDPKKFNYLLFKDDLNKFRKKEGYTFEYISQMKLYRCKGYLSTMLGQKALPVNMLEPICEFMGTKASKYKIEEKPEPVEDDIAYNEKMIQAAEKTLYDKIHNCDHLESSPVVSSEGGWECRIKVDEDFETVMMKVLKNGEEMALSRCYFFSKDDVGIMQAISYAAHQCYKSYQQTAFAQQEVDTELRAKAKEINESTEDPNDTRSFKNWIKKYENEVGRIGNLARYCKSMYSYLPSHGERKLRMFFQLEKEGRAHVDTFNAIWPLYLKEYNAAERACNMRVANEA